MLYKVKIHRSALVAVYSVAEVIKQKFVNLMKITNNGYLSEMTIYNWRVGEEREENSYSAEKKVKDFD